MKKYNPEENYVDKFVDKSSIANLLEKSSNIEGIDLSGPDYTPTGTPLRVGQDTPAIPESTPDVAIGESKAEVPAVTTPTVAGPVINSKGYDPNYDYMASMQKNIQNGNVFGAMMDERARNLKISDMGLDYNPTSLFSYNDTKGIGGLKEAKYNELQDYYDKGFNYDYETDPEYLAMKNLKQKEADKAYKDGYAQLSRSFDGDIPVNMINKLLTTKSEIVDQADSYIPQLKQLAYEMYMDKGNQLYNQYNMLDAEEKEQYGRYYNNLNFMSDAIANNYINRYNEGRDAVYDNRYTDETAYNRGRDEIADKWKQTEYDRAVLESDREYNLRKDEAEYKKLMDEYYTYYDMATMIWQSNPGMGWRTAWDLAKNKKWLD